MATFISVFMVILILVIIIMAILASAVVTNIDLGEDIRNYQYMRADIELLEAKVMTYYNQRGTIPTTGELIEASSILGDQKNLNDNENYYRIDISKLYNVTLNYGGGTEENKDIYIINEQSHNVYYLKGTEYEGKTYYTYTTRNGT